VRVTYFVNLYPAVSHTFIRREIAALEALGVVIQRISIRPSSGIVDSADRDEEDKTRCLTELGLFFLLSTVVWAAVTRPLGVVRAVRSSLSLARVSRLPLVKILAYLVEAILVVRLAREHGSDLLRVHFGTNGALIARLARRLGGPPYVVAYHGPDEFDAPERWDIAGVVADSVFVTAISSFCAAQLMRWSNSSDWDKIKIVRCSVDERQLIHESSPPLSPFRACMVARLAPQKGLHLALKAVAAIRKTGITICLDIAGSGPEERFLRSETERLGLSELVKFHGSLPGEEVTRLIQSSHIMLLPSFAEGLPVVIMEAFALGRPVVATQIAGIPELVRNGENGWLVPAGNVEELKAALEAAHDSSVEVLSRMGQMGRCLVKERHSSAREGARLLGLLNEARL
jgi:glycosyltransferase involved in cell wall biosynthesis